MITIMEILNILRGFSSWIVTINDKSVAWSKGMIQNHISSGWLGCNSSSGRAWGEQGWRSPVPSRQRLQLHSQPACPDSAFPGLLWVLVTGWPAQGGLGQARLLWASHPAGRLILSWSGWGILQERSSWALSGRVILQPWPGAKGKKGQNKDHILGTSNSLQQEGGKITAPFQTAIMLSPQSSPISQHALYPKKQGENAEWTCQV